MKNITVPVLGRKYRIIWSNEKVYPGLSGNAGYCDPSIAQCVLNSETLADKATAMSFGDMGSARQATMRHELIHAMTYESGLWAESWALNEELVDWIALQWPKMAKMFADAGCDT